MSSLQLRAYRVETAPVPKDWLRLGHNYGGDAHERSHEEEDGRRTDDTAMKTHDKTTEQANRQPLLSQRISKLVDRGLRLLI